MVKRMPHIWRSLMATDVGYHEPQPAKPTETPSLKKSVFQTTYFLFETTFFAFQTRFCRPKSLIKMSKYFAVN